jgi:hypothetical protein
METLGKTLLAVGLLAICGAVLLTIVLNLFWRRH